MGNGYIGVDSFGQLRVQEKNRVLDVETNFYPGLNIEIDGQQPVEVTKMTDFKNGIFKILRCFSMVSHDIINYLLDINVSGWRMCMCDVTDMGSSNSSKLFCSIDTSFQSNCNFIEIDALKLQKEHLISEINGPTQLVSS